MSKLTIEISGVELVDQSGAAIFSTDWQEIDQPGGIGKGLTITAHFPNTLTGGGTQQMALEVSNDGVNPQEKIEVDIDDGIESELNWRYIRFDYRLTGAAPTGNVSSIKAELL